MENNDKELWDIAKKRVAFKKHLATYIIMNGFFWAIWWFTKGKDYANFGGDIPWPIWSSLGWGLGLAFNYYAAYHSNGNNDIQKEYEKMKNNTEK